MQWCAYCFVNTSQWCLHVVSLTHLDGLAQLSGTWCCVWVRAHFKGAAWSNNSVQSALAHAQWQHYQDKHLIRTVALSTTPQPAETSPRAYRITVRVNEASLWSLDTRYFPHFPPWRLFPNSVATLSSFMASLMLCQSNLYSTRWACTCTRCLKHYIHRSIRLIGPNQCNILVND